MDVGTRSYIENVLQTKVKNSSADRNWRKLRTGMFVVRALGKEVTTTSNTIYKLITSVSYTHLTLPTIYSV